jgi:hypothetical protein
LGGDGSGVGGDGISRGLCDRGSGGLAQELPGALDVGWAGGLGAKRVPTEHRQQERHKQLEALHDAFLVETGEGSNRETMRTDVESFNGLDDLNGLSFTGQPFAKFSYLLFCIVLPTMTLPSWAEASSA